MYLCFLPGRELQDSQLLQPVEYRFALSVLAGESLEVLNLKKALIFNICLSSTVD